MGSKRMMGARTKQTSAFCDCKECGRNGEGCRVGSRSRKFDRKVQRKVEKREFRKDLINAE